MLIYKEIDFIRRLWGDNLDVKRRGEKQALMFDIGNDIYQLFETQTVQYNDIWQGCHACHLLNSLMSN